MNQRASSYLFGPFRLDANERRLTRGSAPVPLTSKAFDTLLALVRRGGHLVEKDELMRLVWADTFVEEANLAQHIFLLRKALGAREGGGQYIETVPRRGYRFVAPVTVEGSYHERAGAGEQTETTGSARHGSAEQAINSLAVLPLVNVSSDEQAEYLSDGITESIINILSQLPQLRVMAHSTVLRYKGRDVDAREAGRELGVSAILTGRVLQLGDRLIIRTELVDVANGWQLWGEQYERPPADILEVQEEIARRISDKLRLKLTSDEKRRLGKRHTEDTAAYHLYLRGRYFWNKYDAMKGLEYFEQAIAADPNYALAYAGLADSYHRLSSIHLSPTEARAKAKAAALKAVECDDALAEAHLSLGMVRLFYDYDWPGAEREYRRAMTLNPGAALAHLRYGAFLMYLKRYAEAIAEFRLALELDPLSIQTNLALGTVHYLSGRYDEALEQYQRTLELDQNYYPVKFSIGVTYLRQARYAEAIALLEQVSSVAKDNSLPLAYAGNALALAGRHSEAREMLRRLLESAERIYVSTYGVAVVYAGLGDKEQALAWLEKSYEEHSDWLLWLEVAPEFDDLRSDPRYQDLLRRVGFPASNATERPAGSS